MNKNLKNIIGILTSLLFILIFSFDFFSSIGIGLFFYFGIKFFNEIGEKIEIKDIIILIAILQWIIGPVLAYKVYPDEDMYYMAVDIETYMRFVVPATFAFVIGLYLPLSRNKIDNNYYLYRIKIQLEGSKKIDIIFIIIGLFLNYTIDFFPSSIRFAVALVSDIRFIGLYFLFMNKRKYKFIIIGIVLSTIIVTSMRYAMFHELLLWLSFFLLIVAFIIKPTLKTKVISAIIFLFLIVSIQTVKQSFRNAINEGEGKGVAMFTNLVREQVIEGDYVSSDANLSGMVTRINQGWIIARIMHWTPTYEPFAGGETINVALQAAFMPRFLFPDKVTAGGRTYFTRFTGKDISDNTSMGLSLLGEAYANYGVQGGIVFMFIIGFFYNFFIFMIYRIANKHPTLIFFIPLIFLQVVKAETDFSVIINHLFKASIAVWIIYFGINKFLGIKI